MEPTHKVVVDSFYNNLDYPLWGCRIIETSQPTPERYVEVFSGSLAECDEFRLCNCERPAK